MRGALLLAACLLGGPVLRAAAQEVAVDYRDGVYFGKLQMAVPVASATALAVLTDFDHMASFVPNLTASRVLVRAGNVYRVAQEGRAGFGPFSFRFSSERRIEVMADGRVVARAISGSTRQMRSELRLAAAAPGETRIDYRIEMEPDLWVPSAFGSSFLRHELGEQFQALAREMVRREAAAKKEPAEGRAE